MASIDFDKLFKNILVVAESTAEEGWPAIRDFAKGDLEKLARTAVEIAEGRINGTITENGAKALLKMNQNAVETVLAGAAGVTKLVAERVINAVLGVVKDAIKAATGFAL